MREIKFRAWNEEEKQMLYNYIGVVKSKVITLEGGFGGYSTYDNLKPMQYTGLKDKNGKEVYEGDIVNCSIGCPHEVIFEPEYGGTYGGGMPCLYLSGLKPGYAWTGEEEIIGNIYENPDLLQ